MWKFLKENKEKPMETKSNLLSYLKIILINTFIFLIGLFLIEIFFILYIKSHTLQKAIELPQFLRHYIKFNITDIIQNKEDCAKYDKELFYTLKPGNCIFDIADSTDEYSINSLGVRDDEESLTKPDVVFLGDSYTMGWGVSNEETYVKLIENKTGLKVLNAGISSYGTAREIGLLERIDTSNLKYLVIQYCPNDHDENLSFLKNNNVLQISSEEKFQNLVEKEKIKSKYYPSKYLIEIFNIMKRNSTEKREYAKLIKDFTSKNVDKNQAIEIYPNFEIETEFAYSTNSNKFVHLNGWAYDVANRNNLQSISFFINGKEAPAKLITGIDRLDLVPKIKNLGSYKIGWIAEVLLPDQIEEDQILEKILQDTNGKLYKTKSLNSKEIVFSKTRYDEAETFLQVLSSERKGIKDETQLIVFSLFDYQNNDSTFLTRLEKYKNSPKYPKFIQNLKVLNVQDSMPKDHFFRVDDHINEKGHAFVAEKLYDLIKN